MLELQGYLGDQSRIPGVEAVPGKGSHVPLYILGSSLFGAKLAAALGLPYAFASHFAPADLLAAIAAYRDEFKPSEQLDRPHVIAGVNVIAAETTAAAHEQLLGIRRIRAAQPLRATAGCAARRPDRRAGRSAAGSRRVGPGGPHDDLHRGRAPLKKWATTWTTSSSSPAPTS